MKKSMRPHTRTQCQESGASQCLECRSSSSPPPPHDPNPISTNDDVPNCGAPSNAPDPDSLLFAVPSSGSRVVNFMASNMSSVSSVDQLASKSRGILIVELPAEVLVKILGYLTFNDVSGLRMVSRRFNELCASMLNTTFQKLQSLMLQRFHTIKSKMPRRESARRNHPLARESDIVETLHMRLTLLQMTFGKHIERKHVCFFAGEILDEVHRIIRYIKHTPNLGRAYKVTDELFDLSTMAMEYFKEHIEPTLPEITYFGAEFLDFAAPFPSPTKRRAQSGANASDSPCSSGASVAGSACSDPWSSSGSSSGPGVDQDEFLPSPPSVQQGGSNMVLRKRIRRIRQGMKRYNDQMVEVKRELKTCKTKMETQTKQVNEYSQRLEEYDKKFEENSRKFQTMLTELNKCKTELQFWRSKSTLLLAPSAGGAFGANFAPLNWELAQFNAAAAVEDAAQNLADPANPDDEIDPRGPTTRSSISAAENPASPRPGNSNSGGSAGNSNGRTRSGAESASSASSCLGNPASPRPVTRSGPPSPAGALAGNSNASICSRKRVRINEEEVPRKSMRGVGVKNRGAKRPKV